MLSTFVNHFQFILKWFPSYFSWTILSNGERPKEVIPIWSANPWKARPQHWGSPPSYAMRQALISTVLFTPFRAKVCLFLRWDQQFFCSQFNDANGTRCCLATALLSLCNKWNLLFIWLVLFCGTSWIPFLLVSS